MLPLAAAAPDQPWQMRFTGRSAVVLPLDPALDIGSTYSFELWVYPERQLGNATLIRKAIPDIQTDPFFAYQLTLDAQGQPGWGQTRGGVGTQMSSRSSTPLPLNTWSHLAVTCDGSLMILYLNGTEIKRQGSPGGPPPVNSLPIHLGASVNPSNTQSPAFAFNGFVGFLRQFSMWNRALTPAQIRASMDTAPTGSEAGLIAYLPLDDGPGYRLRDAGPNHIAAANLLFAPTTFLQNGTTSMTPQAQPAWLRSSTWNAAPFDWTVQPQPTVNGFTKLYPIDFDNDGHVDLVGGGSFNPGKAEPALKAYRNDGKGHFTDVTQTVFGAAPMNMRGPNRAVVADLNHDGRPDLVIGDMGSDYACCENGLGQNRVFLQTADGRLVDETQSRIPIEGRFAHDNDGADVDSDGNVDLLFAEINGSTDPSHYFVTLMMNDGSGHFTTDSSRLPQSVAGKLAGFSRFLDVNRDGFPDIFLGFGETTNGDNDMLLLNDGTGHFREAPAGALPARLGGANCATLVGGIADLNGDGYPDLIRSLSCDRYTHGAFQVLINRGNGTFVDATAQWLPDSLILAGSAPADAFPIAFSFTFADFNSDGRPDMLLGMSGAPSRLYLNNGSRLMEVSEFIPNLASESNPPWAIADVDGDGRPDLVFGDQPGTTVSLLQVGLNKRDFPAPPSPATDALAPWIGPLSVLNEASMSADPLAPGTRVRIRGTNLGPAQKVVFPEAPGPAPPAALGGVTVTFDDTPARLMSVSATELVALVPYSVAGQWLSTVRVAYLGRTSNAIPVVIHDANPQVYASSVANGYAFADVWKLDSNGRTRITTANQLKWGDRVALRVTGAGQTASPMSDDQAAQSRPFTPGVPLRLLEGTAELKPVSVTYAPDGLSGVVEIVADLPATQPDAWVLFTVPTWRYTRRMVWPFNGLMPDPPACTYSLSANGQAFAAAGGGSVVVVNTPFGCSWTYGSPPSWITLDANSGVNFGSVQFHVSATTSAARSGKFSIAGMSFAITQAAATAGPVPVISKVQDAASTLTTVVPGEWIAIYGANLAGESRSWSDDDFTGGLNLPTFLSGVTVKFNGIPAAVFYVSPTQIDAQAPAGISGSVAITVSYNGAVSAPFPATAAANAPSLYAYQAGAKLYAAATHTDNSLVGDPAVIGNAGTKARPGETIVLYVNGLAASPAGTILGAIPYANPVTVTFTPSTGSAITVAAAYAGVAFAGGFQVNVAVPAELKPGDYTITVSTQNKTSPGGVTLPVGP